MHKDWGGIERYIAFLTSELARRGIPVSATAPAGSPLAKHLEVKTHSIRLLTKYDPLALAAHIRLFRRDKPQFIVTHFSPDYIVPAMAARIARVPKVLMTRHVAVTFKGKRAEHYNRLYDGFVAISQTVVEHLIADGIPQSKIQLALSGSPPLLPTLSKLDSRAGLDPAKFHVGVFGRLHWVKGQEIAIRSVAALPNVALHIYGEGTHEPELRRLVLELKLDGRVIFEGYKADVANHMLAMDAVMVPSIWKEAFGLTVVEAMSIGQPIIANATGGIPEVLTHDKNAILIRSDDPEKPTPADFEAAISKLANQPDLCAQLGTNARRAYESMFTLPHMADRVVAAYQQLLSI